MKMTMITATTKIKDNKKVNGNDSVDDADNDADDYGGDEMVV